jgi:hypothetical protein
VEIDGCDLAHERRLPAKETAGRASVGRADDRVRGRARLDEIPLTDALVQKRSERMPAELFSLVERPCHRFAGGCNRCFAASAPSRHRWKSGWVAIQTEAKTITPTSHHRTATPTAEPAVTIQRTTYPLQQRNAYVSSRRWRKLVTVGHLFRAGQVSCPPLGTNSLVRSGQRTAEEEC